MITLESTSHYVFNVTDNSYFNVTLGEYFPENSSLTHDGDTFTFTWNLTTFDEDHNNMTLTFIAMDDQGAIAFLQPQLLICPCKNSGNCTTGGLLSITDNPLLMNCLCNPGIKLL